MDRNFIALDAVFAKTPITSDHMLKKMPPRINEGLPNARTHQIPMWEDRWLCVAERLRKIATFESHECSTWVCTRTIESPRRRQNVCRSAHPDQAHGNRWCLVEYINPSTLRCCLLHHTSPIQELENPEVLNHVLLALCSRLRIARCLARCSLLCIRHLFKIQAGQWMVCCLLLPSATIEKPMADLNDWVLGVCRDIRKEVDVQRMCAWFRPLETLTQGSYGSNSACNHWMTLWSVVLPASRNFL